MMFQLCFCVPWATLYLCVTEAMDNCFSECLFLKGYQMKLDPLHTSVEILDKLLHYLQSNYA